MANAEISSSQVILNAFHDVFEALTNLGNQIFEAATNLGKQVFTAIASLSKQVNAVFIFISQAVWRGICSFANAISSGLQWIFKKAIFPIALTGINVTGYLLDKILFGSPFLRPYLQHGVFASEIPLAWREWVRNNSGWDIYETMGEVPSNILGLLGLGMGWLNIFNHAVTSIGVNIKKYYHLLGENGFFGSKEKVTDERNLFLKISFGLLTAPVTVAFVLPTNLLDGVLAFAGNLLGSYELNFKRFYHLLGRHGIFGPRINVKDERHIVTQVIYGILSFPAVLGLSIVTNTLDCFAAFSKNFAISFWKNTRACFNLLGENGIFGQHQPLNDERHLAIKIIFGIFSAPFVLASATITNLADLTANFIKNVSLSFSRNISMTYNLLGENGIFGPRQTLHDNRHIITKVIYGAISAPFVLAAATITNLVDLTISFTKNVGLSFWRNLSCTYNLLGKDGIFGPRQSLHDDRHLVTKIIYGVISAPFVACSALLTNLVDGIAGFSKNAYLSFWYNLSKTYNLLGEQGIFGLRQPLNDPRSLLAKIVYGVVTSPFVATVATITNTVNLIGMTINDFRLSYWQNLSMVYHLLGNKGVFGDKCTYQDQRHIIKKIIFGALTAPFVFATATITNTLDILISGIKHLHLSFWRNVSATYNFLGQNGIYGSRIPLQDNRPLGIKIICGTITAPLVAATVFLTNTVDLLITGLINSGISFMCNFRSIANVLGKNGCFGARVAYHDERHLAFKAICGILTAPLVCATAIISNTIDFVATGFKHLSLSWLRNLSCVLNVLGNHGMFGPRQRHEDNRHLAVKVIFGILTAPLVATTALITNAIDFCFTTIFNSYLSFIRNFTPVANLLGENGLFGNRQAYKDHRNLVFKWVGGIITAPLVAACAMITNLIDVSATFLKHTLFSFTRNIACSYNLIGELGIFGPRLPLKDDRGLAAKIIYGAITAPFGLPVIALTNTIDLIGAYFKNWQQTIKMPALLTTGLTVGPILAVPTFMIRKTLKGVYNIIIKPLQDVTQQNPFNGGRMVRGLLNVFTLGAASAFIKVFKACTGYSHRFGFIQREGLQDDGKNINYFKQTQMKFKQAIDLAIQGKLPKIAEGQGLFRPMLRVFYGMRHKSEEILKIFHNHYLRFSRNQLAIQTPQSSAAFNMNAFFSSKEFNQAEEAVRTKLRPGEDEVLTQVENYLRLA